MALGERRTEDGGMVVVGGIVVVGERVNGHQENGKGRLGSRASFAPSFLPPVGRVRGVCGSFFSS